MTIQESYVKIMAAICAEDLFGEIELGDNESAISALDAVYEKLKIRPDEFRNDSDLSSMAQEAFDRLNRFYESARRKIENGDYGCKKEFSPELKVPGCQIVSGKKYQHALRQQIAEGDLSDVFSGQCLGADEFADLIAVKIIREVDDDQFARKEIKALSLFQSEPGKQSKHLPYLLDEFRTDNGQIGVVLRHLDGVDLISIRESERYREGLPLVHVAWILERLLSVVGFSHSRGVIHGNIEPSHLLISPEDHNLFLIDWSYAVIKPAKTGDCFTVYNPLYSAPEVKEGKEPIPSADLYSVGKCVVYMLGGNVETNEFPAETDDRFVRFINNFLLASPLGRAQDAWEMWMQWRALRQEILGERKFHELKI